MVYLVLSHSNLLCSIFPTNINTADPNIKVSSITFGAPPSLSTDITSLLQLPSLNRTRSLIIDFVNEFDVVSRVDRNYLLSLVDLYRSIYDLPPVERTGDEWSDVAKAKEENEKPILPRFSFDDKDMDKMDVWKGRGKLWSLPRSEYVGLGEAVVLGVRVIEKEERVKKLDKELEGNFEKTSGNASESEDEDELALTAVKVRKEQFSKLLFCNVNVHRRTAYRERMGMIMEGRFNGKAGRT